MRHRSYRYTGISDRFGTHWRAHAMALLAVLAVLGLSGCSMFKTTSKKDAIKEMEWVYAEDGIELQVRAHEDLNRSDGQAHTLLLVVAQLEEPGAFDPYTAGSDKLASLLLADSAPAGLLTMKKYFIEPDSERTVQLARVEKARYVAIALGYQHLDPARSTRLYQIGAELDRSGLVLRNYRATPEPLRIELLLGADSVLDGLTMRRTPPQPELPRSGLVVPRTVPATPASPSDESGAAVERIRISSPPPHSDDQQDPR